MVLILSPMKNSHSTISSISNLQELFALDLPLSLRYLLCFPRFKTNGMHSPWRHTRSNNNWFKLDRNSVQPCTSMTLRSELSQGSPRRETKLEMRCQRSQLMEDHQPMAIRCSLTVSLCRTASKPRSKQLTRSGFPPCDGRAANDSPRLSKTRRKRSIPEDWATPEDVGALKAEKLVDPLCPGSRSFAVDATGDLLLLGGSAGDSVVFSISQKKILQSLKGVGGAITDAIWSGNRAIIATSTGIIQTFEDGLEHTKFSHHAGEVTALAIHPSGDILASVGTDKSFVLYDLESSTIATQIHTDAGESKEI